jgi:hypothetical protein
VWRFVLWRLLGLVALIACVDAVAWLAEGGIGSTLRARPHHGRAQIASHLPALPTGLVVEIGRSAAATTASLAGPAAVMLPTALAAMLVTRALARRRRRYVRMRVVAYRGDHGGVDGIVAMIDALHALAQCRWWRRLAMGQPSLSLEVHWGSRPGEGACLAVACLRSHVSALEAALRVAYPSCCLRADAPCPGGAPVLVRLKKRNEFIKRARSIEELAPWREPPLNRLLTVMGTCQAPVFVQLALTPTPALFEAFSKHLYKRHERRLSNARTELSPARQRSLVEDVELRGGLEVQHRSLFFADVRVVGTNQADCRRVASELRSQRAENRLVERGTALRQQLLGCYSRRVIRGEGNPLPPLRKGVFASAELATMWHLPTADFLAVPFARASVPFAPASPAIFRPVDGPGALRDAIGPVSIHPSLRRQNTAVPGAVEQGKSSFLIATVAEDIRRARCAVIVLDPKGDAAEAAISTVPPQRTCTLLDFAHPTCGFNPLAVDAPADVIADYVVGALKNLFSDADIRASSDRYLRNAIIAVLAYDRHSTLWDAARLLSVGEEGYAYRSRVAARVRALPAIMDRPNFFDVSVFGGAADSVGAYMRRGSLVAIDGRLEWREWETAEHGKRQAVSIVADTVQFLDRRDGTSADAGDGSVAGRELVGVGADDDLGF